jgi:hypothetical protein
MTTNEALQELLHKQAIVELVIRYSRTLDWLDDAGHAACYWPDAAIDYGFFVGAAADFVPVVMDVERSTGRRWHMLNSHQVTITSPTTAIGECYGIATGLRQDGDAPYKGNMYGGRYLDGYEMRHAQNGPEWRISERKYILDWVLPLPDQPDTSPNPDFPLTMLDLTKSRHPLYRPM